MGRSGPAAFPDFERIHGAVSNRRAQFQQLGILYSILLSYADITNPYTVPASLAQSIMIHSLLLPALAHMALTLALYAWLTFARARAVKTGQARYSDYQFAGNEPPQVARITRNLANQFELPLFFYVAILALMQLGSAGMMDVILGWLFVAGRVLHTMVQTRTDNVPLRGQVFMLNSVAVAGLIGHLALVVLGFI